MDTPANPPHYLADAYNFKWPAFRLRMPFVSATAVGVCIFAGILAGHPGAGLIAGGGAFAIGFGPNQRVADSRLIPMIAGVLATAASTLVGTVAGRHSYWLVLAATLAAALYGLLTARHTGVSWVVQQATIAMLVASAFPTGLQPALIRAGLLASGGVVQLLFTTSGLSLLPALRKDLAAVAVAFFPWAATSAGIGPANSRLIDQLRAIPSLFPSLNGRQTLIYCVRMVLTLALATELYRRSGVQSGYWIAMTALLVQKPALAETFARATARTAGTVAGAWLCTLLIAHVPLNPVALALMATLFALLAYATNPVNYALYAVFLTGYIVFLLSLNQIPAPIIAERRAWCTVAGGLVALLFHLDALRPNRVTETETNEAEDTLVF